MTASFCGLAQHSNYYYQKKEHFESLPDTPGEIIFLGNSITDGPNWSELFGNPNIKNRGISGDITQGILDRLDEVTSSEPTKVFLMIGINDLARGISVEKIHQNHQLIIEHITQATNNTAIYLQSVLPVNPDIGDKFEHHKSKLAAIHQVNENLKLLAQSYGLVYIDLYSSFINNHGKH